jgi:tetratricopeptide (TPR) repeat protein
MEGYNEGNARPPFVRPEEYPRFNNQYAVEEDAEVHKPQKMAPFDMAALWVLSALVFLLPIFFLPVLGVSLQATKFVLFAGGVLIALALYIVARMKERAIVLPTSIVVYAVWLIPLAYLLSTLFSRHTNLSFLGNSLGVDSFGAITLLALLFTLAVFLARKKRDILLLLTSILGGGVVLALYHILRFIAGSEVLSFGIFSGSSATPLGNWNGLAIFFGLVTIFAMVVPWSMRLQRTAQIVVGVALAVSLFFLSVINFALVWWAVGIAALGSFVYSITARGARAPVSDFDSQASGGVSFSSLIVLAISVIMLFSGTAIGNVVNDTLGISNIAVRPSWSATVDIARATLSEQALFGSGPGTFAGEWLLHKPVEVNTTLFWNVDFATGFGFLPTAGVTTGIVGLIAFATFFGFLLFTGLRMLVLRSSQDSFSYALSLVAFLGALYLFIFAFLHPLSLPLLVYAFLLAGLFIGSLRLQDGGLKEKTLSFVANPRVGFLVVLGLTVVFLGSIATLFSVGEQYGSIYFVGRATSAFGADGDIVRSEEYIRRSIELGDNDQARRVAANLEMTKLRQIAANPEGSQEEVRARFQNVFSSAISHAQRATELNPSNYQNWQVLAQVYQSVVSLNVEGAYDNARRAYDEALTRNPQSPFLSLARAELEMAKGDTSAAREHITNAIQKKGNYTEAIYLLAQIQINEGEVAEATQSVEAATIIDPNNPVAFFQLGVLRYSSSDFVGAISALERAVTISADYANARYFLGLSYDRLGEKERAIAQFNKIAETNPDNVQVKEILSNLHSGISALGEPPKTPVEEVVEREELPVPTSDAGE